MAPVWSSTVSWPLPNLQLRGVGRPARLSAAAAAPAQAAQAAAQAQTQRLDCLLTPDGADEDIPAGWALQAGSVTVVVRST